MPIPDYYPAAGITPLSAFYPQLFEPLDLPSVFLADDTGNTGELQSITEGRDAVDDQVVTAIRAAFESGTALGAAGNRLRSIKKIDGTTQNGIKFLVEDALKTLVKNGDISDISIQSETDDYLGAFFLQYRNLRSGKSAVESVRTLPLPIL